MSNRSRAWLLVLAAGSGAVATAPEVLAQAAVWSGGTPVYQSDVEERERAQEAARAERRKTSYQTVYPRFMEGGARPDIQPEKPPVVYLEQDEKPGTIIVDTAGRKLYFVLPGKQAYAYPISVGRDGFTWTGTEKISRVVSWPTWTPPPEMRQRQPGLPVTVTGGVINPLGAKALYLGNSIYRIHGTSNERSIGRASSSGCFRMLNEHVTHLSTIAGIGTTVRVVASYSGVSEGTPISALFSGLGGSSEPAPAAAAKKKPRVKVSASKAAAAPAQ